MRSETTPIALLLWLLLALAGWPAVAQSSAQQSPELQHAQALLAEGRFLDAAKAFKKARKKEREPSFETAIGMAAANNRLGLFNKAMDSAEEALALAGSAAEELAAHGQIGIAAFAHGNADREGFEKAEAALRQVMERDPESMVGIRFLYGVVLLRLERDDDGLAHIRDFLDRYPEGPTADQARSYLDDPRRARMAIVPKFLATTLDGQTISSDSLRGKVVLFDFWGTWCKPCRESVPHLKKLARKSEKEPFLIVGMASDRSEEVVEDFTTENDMSWPQILDARRQLAQTFGVNSYPTYVLVDHEGVIVFQDSGYSSRMEAQVSSAVRKALRALRRSE